MDYSKKVTVYSSETSSRSVFHIFKEIIKELPQSHELGLRLFKRNIKAMYRQSLLGLIWALFPPLITAALWIFLRSNNVMSMGDTGISYPVFVIIGTMLWQIFSESIQAPIKNVQINRSLLIKINIPREALLLSGFYELIFNVLIKLFLLVIVFFAFQQQFGWSLVMVPIGIAGIMIVGFSIGLIMTPIGMLYQDIQRGLTIVLPFLMYLTPVVYPKPSSGIVALIMKVNPMAILIPETRNWFTSQANDQLGLMWIYMGGFFCLLLIAIIIYRLSMPMIIERAGS